MAFQGNAFALLDGDDNENLPARVTTAVVEAPPAAVADKQRSGNHKKPMPASKSVPRSSPASDHEKGRYNRNGNDKQQNRNGLESQINNNFNGYNRDGGNKNGFKRSDRISNGYRKKVEATNGRSNGIKKEEAGVINGKEGEAGNQKKEGEANGDSNGSQKKEEEEGWQIVVGKSNIRKQKSRERTSWRYRNNYGQGRLSNGNLSEVKVFEENQHSQESGENGVRSDSTRVETENNGSVNGQSIEGAADENEKTSESKESLKEGLEEDGKSVMSKEELERLEHERKNQAEWEAKKLEQKLEAKKMTLKQYEKQLEEKRKALDSLKAEERKVTVDEDFNAMLAVGKKNGEEANFIQLSSTSEKPKKKAANNREDNKVKKIVFSPPPSAGRGGRNPRREDGRNGDSTGRPDGFRNRSVPEGSRKVPDTHKIVEKAAAAANLPPPFKDVQQFPALG